MSQSDEVARNKELIRQICRHLSARDVPALFELIHEEGSWSIPYRPDRFHFAGFRSKSELRDMLGGFLGIFDHFAFEIRHMVAEGDRVVVEARSEGATKDGATYENTYLMIFFIKDGKAHTVREFFDPFQVLAFVDQLPAA